MTRRQRLSDDGVARLKPKSGRQYTSLPNPELPNHYVRVSAGGAKSFVVVVRDGNGKQHWRTIGAPPMLMTMRATLAGSSFAPFESAKSRPIVSKVWRWNGSNGMC